MRLLLVLSIICITGAVVTFFVIIQSSDGITSLRTITFRLTSQPLLERNDARLVQLYREYSFLLNISSYKTGNPTDKTMIYSCQGHCGGWGDRLRGIVSVFILARLTNRRFMIDMNYPCPIAHALVPNLVDWTYAPPRRRSDNHSRLTLMEVPPWPIKTESSMIHILTYHDFLTLWFMYDEVWITTNGDFVTSSLRNHYSANFSRILLRHFPLVKATMETFLAPVFEFLFKPTINVQNRVDSILMKSHGRHLICLHIRMGKNPSNPSDRNFPLRVHIVDDMLKFVDTYIVNKSIPFVFVTSDSDEAVSKVLKHLPNISATTYGPILHVDKVHDAGPVISNGFIKVIADFYLLGECETSILSHSGFSTLANRRRKDPHKNLYIYDESLRVIRKA